MATRTCSNCHKEKLVDPDFSRNGGRPAKWRDDWKTCNFCCNRERNDIHKEGPLVEWYPVPDFKWAKVCNTCPFPECFEYDVVDEYQAKLTDCPKRVAIRLGIEPDEMVRLNKLAGLNSPNKWKWLIRLKAKNGKNGQHRQKENQAARTTA